ncbi:MAG: hypothetical protein ACE1S7_05020 [Candidatus Tisiphia sp.]
MPNDPTGQYTAAAKVRESLQQGKWQLTSDKKSVYYTFPIKDGRYLPVVAKDGKILKFDLLGSVDKNFNVTILKFQRNLEKLRKWLEPYQI